MSRDYAKSSSSRSRHAVPGWVWMTIGLMVGLFVAFLLYLNQAKLPVTEWQRPALLGGDGSEKTQTGGTDATGEPQNEKVNFDFYNVLPEFEVPVPDTPQPSRPTTPPEEPEAPAGDTTANEPPKAPATGAYIIQAGSFSNPGDADTRKAQLALLGIVSKVRKVTIDGSKTFHRVQVGPYDDPETLKRVRTLLKENSIEYMLLKQRG